MTRILHQHKNLSCYCVAWKKSKEMILCKLIGFFKHLIITVCDSLVVQGSLKCLLWSHATFTCSFAVIGAYGVLRIGSAYVQVYNVLFTVS